MGEQVNTTNQAAEDNQLDSPGVPCVSTVHVWSCQVVDVMKTEASAAHAPESTAGGGIVPAEPGLAEQKASLIKYHVPGYLLRLHYITKCYTDLQHAIRRLEGLAALGCEPPESTAALNSFSEFD